MEQVIWGIACFFYVKGRKKGGNWKFSRIFLQKIFAVFAFS